MSQVASGRAPGFDTAHTPGALEAITEGVAFVRDPYQNLLATNALGRAFYSPVTGDGAAPQTSRGFQFLDRGLQDLVAEPGLVLLVYTAEPGSPSAERIRLLASWAAPADISMNST